MKTKTSKFNILLVAITLLLVFVACTQVVGKTGSWLKDDDDLAFTINISAISIEVKQGTRKIDNNGLLYINTDIIEGDETYSFDAMTICNKEEGTGYYIRFKAIAKVNGNEYNINDYITSDFYKNANGWMYYTANKQSSEPIQMPKDDASTTGVDESQKIIISELKIPSTSADSTKLSTSTMQGKYFRLYIYIEGSPSSSFDI
ncbi:MAG: hypothetical protein IJA72_00785 [Clostridia bacterium]|nr:hypothetical protein [Clostridia bacterium]